MTPQLCASAYNCVPLSRYWPCASFHSFQVWGHTRPVATYHSAKEAYHWCCKQVSSFSQGSTQRLELQWKKCSAARVGCISKSSDTRLEKRICETYLNITFFHFAKKLLLGWKKLIAISWIHCGKIVFFSIELLKYRCEGFKPSAIRVHGCSFIPSSAVA